MKLSRRGEYATKALLYLGARDQEQGVSTAEIAQQTQIPEPFLNQIMLTLKNGGLLRSRRGARGGYVLNRPAENISIGEIARLMDGPLAPIPCASVTAYEPCPSCPEPEACRLRLLMREVRDAVSDILDNTSLADLMRKTNAPLGAEVVTPLGADGSVSATQSFCDSPSAQTAKPESSTSIVSPPQAIVSTPL